MSKYEDRTVAELQDLARDRGLAVSGTKEELIARLRGESPEDVGKDEPPITEGGEFPAESETEFPPEMEVAAPEPGPVAAEAIEEGDVSYQGVPLPTVAQRKPVSVYHPSLTEPGTEPLGAPNPSLVSGDVPALLEKVRSAMQELRDYSLANPGDGVLLHHVSSVWGNLDSLDRAADLHRQMARPPGE
jgi:hypothetical protein